MKKTIMVIGSAFLVIIIIFGAGMAALAIIGKTLDKESKAFVDAAIPAIVSEWDLNELEKRASLEFDDEADYEELEELFDMLQRLGKLEEYEGAAGEAAILFSFRDYEISADYRAIADFEAGSLEIRMTLIKRGGRWQILGFKISPISSLERNNFV